MKIHAALRRWLLTFHPEVAGELVPVSEQVVAQRPAPPTLDALSETICRWGERTFPKASPASLAAHLHDEAGELLDSHLPEEAADVFILLVQYADVWGFNLAEAVQQKHEKNLRRTWGEPDARGVVRHIKEG